MKLEVKELCMSYGNKAALKGVSFSMQPGVYGLLGPNGAGKSTLMQILTGNLTATSGSVLIDGKNAKSLGREYRALLGYMPQQQAYYPFFTASRFLSYLAALKGMTTQQARKRIPEVLAQVGLLELENQRIRSFSGGMKQRLLIAQAILTKSPLLILDEPTAGLDPKQRIAIRNLIAKVALDQIVMIATHVVSDVEYISNEILLLKDGELLCMDTRENLLAPLKGRVVELEISPELLPQIEAQYPVGNISRDGGSLYVRVLTDGTAPTVPFQLVRPTLEDLYLSCFGGD